MMYKKIFLFISVAWVIMSITSCDDTKGPETPAATTENATNGDQPDSLLQAINKRIADEPGNYKNYLDRAKYYGDKGQFDLAHRDIDRAIKTDSTKSEVYFYKGELYWKQLNFAPAQDDKYIKMAYDEYCNCLDKDSLNIQCHLKKAGIDIAQNQYDMANAHLNKVLMIDERVAEAYYLRGRLYKSKIDTVPEKSKPNKVVKYDPEFYNANLELAKSSYTTAIEVDPNYYDAYIELGLLYSDARSDLAKEYFNSAISIRPQSVEAWYGKAIFLQQTGYKDKSRYVEAMLCYDSILAINPSFFASHFNKGYIYLEYLQDYQNGADCFSKAIELQPSYAQAYYNRGFCYESMDNLSAAEKDFRSALSYAPQYTAAAKALDRVLRGGK